MIDSIRARKRADSEGVHPVVREHTAGIVVGGNTQPQLIRSQPTKPQATAPANNFRPPEEVAATDSTENEDEHIDMGNEFSGRPEKPTTPRRSLKVWMQSWGKKQWILFAVVAAVVLGGLGGGAFALFHHKKALVASAPHKAKPAAIAPKSTTVPSTLTGLEVAPAVNQRPTTAVMIENSTFARPQSGLDQAGVVFEAIAEGGITRFMAVYQDGSPDYVGPVRSLRPYYLQWALGFDAAVAHVGGSPEALSDIKSWGGKDLDQFFNSGSYQRITSREAPHNVYTSLSQLNDLENSKGWATPKYTGFTRKKEQPLKTPMASSIDLKISSADFNVHYDWDSASNTYKRSEGGKPHMVVDKSGTQTQLAPKVVVALTMDQGIEADDSHTTYGTTGSGHAYIFQDGYITEGTWHKAGNTDNFTFTDSAGKTIGLNPGQTWITVAGATSDISYH